MTPLQFAREECANHQPDGSCLGAWINEDLSIARSAPKPRCLLGGGERCRYFEACVAPMARMVSDPRRAVALSEAVSLYHLTAKRAAETNRGASTGMSDAGKDRHKGREGIPAPVLTVDRSDAMEDSRNHDRIEDRPLTGRGA